MNRLRKLLNRGAYILVCASLTSCLPDPHTTLRSPEVRGRVLDARTLAPIQDAKIFFTDQPKISCQSDTAGYFVLKETRNFHLGAIPPEGDWPQREYYWPKITISRTNYIPHEINSDSIDKRDIFLTPVK
jgi:hypothetical protein